jgi:uncharacterized membrane-anchored protein YitT (DUF2179 family)
MVQYLFHFSIGYLSLIINIPLILFAWRRLDPDYARKSLLFVAVFSGVTLWMNGMDLTDAVYATGYSRLLGPLAAGVVSGGINGMVMRLNGSTGGTDILAAWVRKKNPVFNYVWIIFTLNALVAAASFFVYGRAFEPVILCLVYCFTSSRISDRILKGGKMALKFEVVTRQPRELADRLMRELHHGVTMLSAEGMYSETPNALLVCVVNRYQVVRFQEILAEFPGCFAYVSAVNETVGQFDRRTGRPI